MKQNGKPIRAGGVVTKLCALLFAVITLLPFAYVLSISLKTKNDLYVFPPELFTKNIQLQNFVDAWGLFDFPRAFLNSFAVAVPTTLLTVLFCSLAAYAFTRLHFRGKNLIFALYLSTMMIPIVVRLIPSYMLINKLKLLNTYVGQILPLTAWSIPFGTFLMRQFIASVPVQLDEAAKIDGATSSQVLRYVTIPMVMPSITICTFLTLTNSFKLFDQNLALTAGEPSKMSEMLALNIYNTFYTRNGWEGVGQAKAVIFFLLVALIAIVQTRLTRSKEVQQ